MNVGSNPSPAEKDKIMFKVKIMLKDFTTAVYDEVKSAYIQDGIYNIILENEIRRFSC